MKKQTPRRFLMYKTHRTNVYPSICISSTHTQMSFSVYPIPMEQHTPYTPQSVHKCCTLNVYHFLLNYSPVGAIPERTQKCSQTCRGTKTAVVHTIHKQGLKVAPDDTLYRTHLPHNKRKSPAIKPIAERYFFTGTSLANAKPSITLEKEKKNTIKK